MDEAVKADAAKPAEESDSNGTSDQNISMDTSLDGSDKTYKVHETSEHLEYVHETSEHLENGHTSDENESLTGTLDLSSVVGSNLEHEDHGDESAMFESEIAMFESDYDGNDEHADDAGSYGLSSEGDATGESIFRVDVSQSEMGAFGDTIIMDEGTGSIDGDVQDDHRVSSPSCKLVEAASKLHCALCGNVYMDPKMLYCLHSFCLKCLVKYRDDNPKFKTCIRCPVCKADSVPKNNKTNALPINSVLKQMIDVKNDGAQSTDCVVCSLRDVTMESTGCCLDCGDLLCDDCCEKHTFTRLTAKHRISPIDHSAAVPAHNKMAYCDTHIDQVANYYCPKCCCVVCRDCLLLEHASHKCSTAEQASQELRTSFEARMKKLNLKLEKLEAKDGKGDGGVDETLNLIEDKQQEQVDVLKAGRDRLVAMIDKEYKDHVNMVDRVFRKFRHHTKSRHEHIVRRRQDMVELKDNVAFLFDEGNVLEVLEMEKHAINRLKAIEQNINKTMDKITASSNFPVARVIEMNVRKISDMHLFNVQTGASNVQPRLLRSDHPAGSAPNSNNNNRQNKTQNTAQDKKRAANAPRKQQPQSLLAGNVSNFRGPGPVGRGKVLSSDSRLNSAGLLAGNVSNMRGPVGRGKVLSGLNTPGLLGEYPGPGGAAQNIPPRNIAPSVNNHPVGQAQFLQNQMRQRGNGCIPELREPVNLKMHFSFDIQTPDDRKMPEIVDIAFTSVDNFVVCDARNQILKAFSCHGRFLDFIRDPGPTSVTFCSNHVIWNSQYTAIKCYNVGLEKIMTLKQFKQPSQHPLTCFMNDQSQRYLVGNTSRSLIEAYTIEGNQVLSVEPRDGRGRVMTNVTRIATHSKDQLVVIDSTLRKVVVLNFDGGFIGEFSRPGMDPAGVCITEHNQIFLTDRARDKLILLSADAEFLKEWSTVTEQPEAVASNHNGILVVTGKGNVAKIYHYSPRL